MAGVKVKPAAAYVIAAEPVVLVDPTTGAPYSATGGGGGGGAVTVADGADVAQGSIADAAYSGTGSGTVVSILKWIGSLFGLPSSTPYSGTGDGTVISVLKGVFGLLATPATQLPKTPLLSPSDLTYVFNSSSASTSRSLVAAVASQTTRGYRMVVTAAGATTLSFTDGSGGSTLYTFEFPAAGAFILDLDSRAYFATSANTALHVISSAAVKTTVALYYLTSV